MDRKVVSYGQKEIETNERLSIINGCFANIGINMVSSFIPLFAIHALHATDQQVGYLNSWPAIVGLFSTLIGMMWMRRIQSKKLFCINSTIAARLCFLFIACIPWLPVHSYAWVAVFVVALMKFPQSFGDLSWQSMIGDMIPDGHRSVFFGRRNRALTIIGMIGTLIPGLILQQFPGDHAGPYQALFIIASVFAIFELYYLKLHIEPSFTPMAPDNKPNAPKHTDIRHLFQGAATIFRNRSFRTFLVCSVIFNFGWQMAWPLFNIFQINDAHATALWISLFTVANQLAQIITYSWWGKMSDKHGNKMMLAVTSIGMALSPILMIASTNLYYLVLMNVFSGIFVAGTTLLLFNELLRVIPEAERTTYIANYNIIIGLVGFLAPQVGVGILVTSHMNAAMTVSTIVRFLGAIAFYGSIRLTMPGSLKKSGFSKHL